MTGDVYVVASGKGGVGKTTTAVNLAVAFGLHGTAAVAVDADLEMPNVGALLDVEPTVTLHDVLSGAAGATEAVVDVAEEFGVVLGDESLGGFAGIDVTRLGDAVGTLADRYDAIVIDTGAGLSHETLLPLGLADEVILVSSPSPIAVEDTRKVGTFTEFLDRPVRGVVLTHVTADVDPEAVAADLDTDVLAAIPYDPALREGVGAGEPVEAHAPDSPAAAAYRRLAARLAGK